ncbi:GvpL/GvpF family gas vesicle protein [Dactylosporangium sp. CS-047395]|uniref:GvpL/GvpF family gas vesicle protein n=1 Tax=Dactylosporangium sp. CS-047395 TaxID=3239936 RepID=UPI003D8A39C1
MAADSAVYVYGIVPAAIETDPQATGIGGATVTAVRHGELAALISELDLDRPLGTPDDLLAHEALLDETAAVVPVLPVRFGAVLANRTAVVDELLATHHDDFLAALAGLEGKAQYVISARYVADAVLREVLAADPRIDQLRAAIRDRPTEAARDERIALGRLVQGALDARRAADTRAVADAVAPIATGVVTREPPGEYGAADVAILADLAREDDLERAVAGLAERRAGQLEVRLLGPLAPYEFVADLRPEARTWDS